VERGEDPTVAVVRDEIENKMIVFESATQPAYENDQHVFVAS